MSYLIIIGFGLAWVGFTIWRERGRPSSGRRRSKGDAGSFYGCGGDSSCGGGGGD